MDYLGRIGHNDIVMWKPEGLGYYYHGRVKSRLDDHNVKIVMSSGLEVVSSDVGLTRITSSYTVKSKLTQRHSVHKYPTLRNLKRRLWSL